MTLEEKVAQLGSRWVGRRASGAWRPRGFGRGGVAGSRSSTSRRCRTCSPPAGTASLEEASRDGLGHLTRVYGSARSPPAKARRSWCASSTWCSNASRLGIPALVHEECLTGFTTFGATVYPAAIAWGATFDPDAGGADGRGDRARHGRARGAPGSVARRSTSCATTAGAGSRRRSARTRTSSRCSARPTCAACRAPACIATLKHFAGYSASRAARNHGPVSMGRRELLDVILPPFEIGRRRSAASDR